MPVISVWPVSSSDSTRKVGSSSARRCSAVASFSWSALVFGSIATAITGSGNSICSSMIGASGAAERVAGGGLLEADAGEDVAGVALLDLLARVGVHHQQPADPLGLAVGRVEHAAARLELARVDAEVGELADERIGHDLEGERRERPVVVGGTRRRRRALLLALLGGLDAGRPARPRAASGSSSTIASSSGCTPLFLKAEPQRTGVTLRSMVAACSDLAIRSCGISCSSRYISMSSSS